MSDPFIGEIKIFGCNFTPRNWSKCQGQTLNISQKMALFSLLGTTFGGDGRTRFSLPDLRGRCIIGATNSTTSHGVTTVSIGASGGQETVTLTQSTIPSHQHEVSIPVSEDLFGSGTENNMGYLQKTSVNNVFQTVEGGNTAKGFSMSTEGSTQAHENRQPYLAVNYCIALDGIFPSRS